MEPGKWDAIWWYRDMRYLGIPCIDGLSTRPLSFGVSQKHHDLILTWYNFDNNVYMCVYNTI